MWRFASCTVMLWAVVAGPAAAQDHPDLSGYWVLKVAPPPPADSAAADSTVRDSTVRDSAVRDSAVRDSTVRDSAVRDSTVRDSTVRDSTVRDSTARDSVTTADSTPAGPPSDLRPVIRRRGRPEEQQQLNRLVGMASPVAAFRITQTDTAITILNDGGFTYSVLLNGSWGSIEDGEISIRVRARWRGRTLEIEYRPPGGGRLIENYALADSEVYLRLEVVVEHDILAQRLWRSRMYRLEEAP
ncbi:MAG: hypothetical protein OEY20_10990 [Gemmatimonadota bacterium]|nr:hypothetical protein [Gemmatimonadota bacterium]